LYTVRNGLPDNWILCLQQASDGSLWIGTKDGFSRWHNGEIETFRSKDGLSQSSAYSAYEDREGSLWVGTKHGLNQFLDGRAIPYTASEGLPSNNTGPVLQDSNGVIWVGTLDAGLARFNGRRFSPLTTRDGLASNSIYALAADDSGGLWVGTDAGLNLLRGGRVTATYTTREGLPSNDIRCLFLDRSEVLWVGTNAGLTTFRGHTFVQPPGLRGVLTGSILAIGQDAQGRIFAATEGGDVHIYANGQLTEFAQNGLPPRDIASFYRDQDGLLWMGTLGSSLRLLKDGKVFNFYMHDGLFDDEIYGILGDGQGRLWMACSKGIFSVSRSDLLKFAAGSLKQVVSSPYIPTDALRTIESKSDVQPAAARMQDGRLWFSTTRGLIAIDPQ
ncbi:MAG: ligand-binding sensor domain-containing protein, partial [Bryobacteraceae bacterium]